jgi:hypothetical protein
MNIEELVDTAEYAPPPAGTATQTEAYLVIEGPTDEYRS